MKSPPSINDDYDDIFGPPRMSPVGYCSPKNRPSMISAKYRQKEERRKILKISFNKLKKIDDPESSLCRSVLINNTMKRLQKETIDEKIQKQQLSYPRCYNDNILNIKKEFIRNEKQEFEGPNDIRVENNFDAKLVKDIVSTKNVEVFNFNGLDEENLDLEMNFSSGRGIVVSNESKRKRSFDDMEDCDVQDVLKQFYMPPTPRMLTCIDDDDEGGVSNVPATKKLKIEPHFEIKYDHPSLCDKNNEFSVKNYINKNNSIESRLKFTCQSEDSNSYSCGHASMFSELQNNVYHNLITSLET